MSLAVLVAGLALLADPGPSCSGGSPEPPPLTPGSVVIDVAGETFTLADLDRFVAFYRRYDPRLAVAHIRRVTLESFLLPARLVPGMVERSDVAEARRKAEELATAVRGEGGGLEALRMFGDALGGQLGDEFLPPWNRLDPNVAEIVFSLDVGQVTSALHAVYGSLVAAVADERLVRGVPNRRLYTVFFAYAPNENLRARVAARIRELRKLECRVHPRLVEDFRPLFPRIEPLTPTR